jgi:translation initiation factor IF-3
MRPPYRTIQSPIRALLSFGFTHPSRALLARTGFTASRSYATKRPKLDRNRRNDEIPFRLVHLVDPETQKLQPLTSLRGLLNSLDLKANYVELVAETPAPVVKVVSHKEEYERMRQQKLEAKARGKPAETKELQMTWGVAPGDLAHKLKKARQELEKGNRVDIVYAPKKGQTVPGVEEMQARMDAAAEQLQDVGKERQARTLEKSMAILHMGKKS